MLNICAFIPFKTNGASSVEASVSGVILIRVFSLFLLPSFPSIHFPCCKILRSVGHDLRQCGATDSNHQNVSYESLAVDLNFVCFTQDDGWSCTCAIFINPSEHIHLSFFFFFPLLERERAWPHFWRDCVIRSRLLDAKLIVGRICIVVGLLIKRETKRKRRSYFRN